MPRRIMIFYTFAIHFPHFPHFSHFPLQRIDPIIMPKNVYCVKVFRHIFK
jgi:hypothetical protein